MDLKKLETFRAVAKYGSLSRAAANHGITFPALSIQIKKLEAELGVKLFDHLPNKLVLTEHGKVFLKESNHVFEALERLTASVTNPADGYSGAVSVSLSADIARFFASGIAAFVQQHPKLNVTIIARSSSETMALVANGDINMGVGFYRKVPRGISKKKICETHFSLVFPRTHPLAHRKRPTLSDIAAYRVVIPRRASPTRKLIDAALSSNAVNLPNILEIGRCQSVMDFVERGLGVGLVHSICACTEPHKKLIQVDMSRYFGKTDVALITRSNAALSAAHHALMQTFIDSAAEVRLAEE